MWINIPTQIPTDHWMDLILNTDAEELQAGAMLILRVVLEGTCV